ncbi:MAG: hypothetical protein WDZ41_00100 [Candidatus Babeliales bacterium]
MKIKAGFLNLAVYLLFYSANAYYVQQNTILIYSKNTIAINKILNKFNIQYENIQNKNYSDDNLYIISGDASSMHVATLPKYYIFHQTSNLHKGLSANALTLFSNAIAVWDCSWDNINRYKNRIKNYYYLPDENYEFLDPIILPCFLPIKALSAYRKLLEYSNSKPSDISMHVPGLFCHCVFQNPELIIEAGVRWGDGSTIPLYEAKKLLNSYLIGLDIVNYSHIYSKLNSCLFLQINDLEFPLYLQQKINIQKKEIDFVFIDTTHDYLHTKKEIEMFTSILSKHGTLGFHDSNPLPGDPDGVKIALKEYFNLNFDESRYGNYIVKKDQDMWNIIHYPFCNGMTIAKRIEKFVL